MCRPVGTFRLLCRGSGTSRRARAVSSLYRGRGIAVLASQKGGGCVACTGHQGSPPDHPGIRAVFRNPVGHRRARNRTIVCGTNEDGSDKPNDELVRELWEAYIQKDFQMSRGDMLKKLGKTVGYSTNDVSTKAKVTRVLKAEYISFLKRKHPEQYLVQP